MSRKSLWINLGDGKCVFLEVSAPRKSCRSESQSESRGPHCYESCSHVPTGIPLGEVTEGAKIRLKIRALTVMDIAFRRRCVLHRGRSVAEGTPLPARISILIDRNYTIIVCFFFDLVIN